MMCKVEIHMKNKGILAFTQYLNKPNEWLLYLASESFYVGMDMESKKHFLINMKEVTGIVVEEKEETDASKTWKDPEVDQLECPY